MSDIYLVIASKLETTTRQTCEINCWQFFYTMANCNYAVHEKEWFPKRILPLYAL